MKSEIVEVSSKFDNIHRIGTEEFLLDVYDIKKEPRVGNMIEYVIDPTEKPTKGKLMTGKVYKVDDGEVHVSFGGLMGLFVVDNKRKGDKFSVWVDLL